MKILTIVLSVVAVSTISACDTIEKVTIQKASDQTTFLSATAANSVSIVKASSDGDIVCMRHAPDALSSASTSVSASNKGTSEGENSGNSEAELNGRTPVVVLVRDAQFELCNMYLNGVIDKSDYVNLYIRKLEIYAPLMLEETKNTTISLAEDSASSSATSNFSTINSFPEDSNDKDLGSGDTSSGTNPNPNPGG